jgi:cell division septation protein DedD
MFFLGILVGRGTAPVSFDTRSFQDSLARVADDSKEQEKTFERPVLDFYEVLKSPMLLTTDDLQNKEVRQAKNAAQDNGESQGEILPIKDESSKAYGDKNSQVLKKSLKGLTFKSNSLMVQNKDDVKPDVKPNVKPDVAPDVEKSVAKTDKKIIKRLESDVKDGNYTIQVAAYRDLSDAVDEIDRLKKKGIPSYRTMGRVGNDIWHRVRTGSFNDMESAQKRLSLLAGYGIKGMILNKKE